MVVPSARLIGGTCFIPIFRAVEVYRAGKKARLEDTRYGKRLPGGREDPGHSWLRAISPNVLQQVETFQSDYANVFTVVVGMAVVRVAAAGKAAAARARRRASELPGCGRRLPDRFRAVRGVPQAVPGQADLSVASGRKASLRQRMVFKIPVVVPLLAAEAAQNGSHSLVELRGFSKTSAVLACC